MAGAVATAAASWSVTTRRLTTSRLWLTAMAKTTATLSLSLRVVPATDVRAIRLHDELTLHLRVGFRMDYRSDETTSKQGKRTRTRESAILSVDFEIFQALSE